MIKHLLNLFLACAAGLAVAAEPPNIVVILADDLGFADVGYHGSKDILSPNIDSIARNGVQFTRGYVTGVVCGPTRAGLMTGRYQQRFGSEGNPGPYAKKGAELGVSLEETLMSSRLKELGYRTACIGKWHMGGERGDTRLFPLQRGFDEFFGILEGAARYEDVHNVEQKYMRGNVLVEREDDYYTDALGREACRFIDESKDSPFFLYLAFNAVHAPMQAKQEAMEKFRDVEDLNRRTLCAMHYSMDENIGRVLEALARHGLEQDTLVVFLSDNGGKPDNNYSVNDPFRGQKGDVYDGGMHVPFCIQWPRAIEPGQTYGQPVVSLDILPTCVVAAGGQPRPDWNLEGVDLMPYILGKKESRPHESLYWKTGKKSAVRQRDWKLVSINGRVELFNLEDDPSESNNLAHRNPEKVEELTRLYAKWDKANIPSNYGWNKALGPARNPSADWKKKLK